MIRREVGVKQVLAGRSVGGSCSVEVEQSPDQPGARHSVYCSQMGKNCPYQTVQYDIVSGNKKMVKMLGDGKKETVYIRCLQADAKISGPAT